MPAGEVMVQARGIGGIGWPVLDGYVIPDDQYVLYRKGEYNDTPILVGINSDEGASFTRTSDPAHFEAETRVRFNRYADSLLLAYPPDSKGSIKQSARNLLREAAFGWHTWMWAKLQSEQHGSNAYVYFFDQRPPLANPRFPRHLTAS